MNTPREKIKIRHGAGVFLAKKFKVDVSTVWKALRYDRDSQRQHAIRDYALKHCQKEE